VKWSYVLLSPVETGGKVENHRCAQKRFAYLAGNNKGRSKRWKRASDVEKRVDRSAIRSSESSSENWRFWISEMVLVIIFLLAFANLLLIRPADFGESGMCALNQALLFGDRRTDRGGLLAATHNRKRASADFDLAMDVDPRGPDPRATRAVSPFP
jgi:hypothetical protein